MPDLPVPVDLSPAALREGDQIMVDPDDPRRPSDWTVTTDAHLVHGVLVVAYRTGDGTEGTHGFEPPLSMLRVLPAPPGKQATGVGASRAVA
jgi:hypothetical protein